MKISLEKKREIILVEHLEHHIPLCYLARKYGISQNELYHIKSRYLLHGEVVFEKHYRNFTNEFKTKLVKEYLEGKSTLDQIALKNNIDKGTLGNWIKRYNDNNGIIITMKKGRNKKLLVKSKTKVSNIENNSKSYNQLKEENLRLKAEVEYLKKLRSLSQKMKKDL